jgi:hypothetical protein
LEGQVLQSIFRGPCASVTVETGGLSLRIEAPALGKRVGYDAGLTGPRRQRLGDPTRRSGT